MVHFRECWCVFEAVGVYWRMLVFVKMDLGECWHLLYKSYVRVIYLIYP